MKFLNGQTLEDGVNIALGTTTGTKIGTSTSQKLGFFNSAPIVQPTGNVLTALQNLGLGASLTILASDLTGTIPVANGGTGNSSLVTTPTANTIVAQNASANFLANNCVSGYTTTATTGGTLILTAASTYMQIFTGTLTHTVRLPVVSTLSIGHSFLIQCPSTGGIIQIQSSGSNILGNCTLGGFVIVTCVSTSGTGIASWNFYSMPGPSTTNTAGSLVQRDGSGAYTAPFATNVSGIVGLANGGTGQNALVTASTASTIVGQDVNKNYFVNNIIRTYQQVTTSGGSLSLTVASPYMQQMTGTSNHTLVMPVKSTLSIMQSFFILNDSTGSITINSSGGSLITTVLPGARCEVICIMLSGTSAAGWLTKYTPSIASTNTVNTVVQRDASGNFAAGTITAALTGNASTATSAATLTTSRNINGVAFNGSADIFLNAQYITNATTAYTFVLSDAFKTYLMTSASANTLTIPLNSSVAFPIGTQIDIVQTGAGKTTIAATGGVTINSQSSNKSIAAQWVGCTLLKTATDTWLLLGNLIA